MNNLFTKQTGRRLREELVRLNIIDNIEEKLSCSEDPISKRTMDSYYRGERAIPLEFFPTLNELRVDIFYILTGVKKMQSCIDEINKQQSELNKIKKVFDIKN